MELESEGMPLEKIVAVLVEIVLLFCGAAAVFALLSSGFCLLWLLDLLV